MHDRFGDRIYGRYGFADAFHPTDGWVNPDVIGIDVGITLLSAENLRTARVWEWFMRNAEIPAAMERVGLTRAGNDARFASEPSITRVYSAADYMNRGRSPRSAILVVSIGMVLVLLEAGLAVRAQEPRRALLQPLAQQARRLETALRYLGEPLSDADRQAIDAALAQPDEADGVRQIEQVLDRRVLVRVHINAESRVRVEAGTARPELVQGGTRLFLVKVLNDAGVTAPLVGPWSRICSATTSAPARKPRRSKCWCATTAGARIRWRRPFAAPRRTSRSVCGCSTIRCWRRPSSPTA